MKMKQHIVPGYILYPRIAFAAASRAAQRR